MCADRGPLAPVVYRSESSVVVFPHRNLQWWRRTTMAPITPSSQEAQSTCRTWSEHWESRGVRGLLRRSISLAPHPCPVYTDKQTPTLWNGCLVLFQFLKSLYGGSYSSAHQFTFPGRIYLFFPENMNDKTEATFSPIVTWKFGLPYIGCKFEISPDSKILRSGDVDGHSRTFSLFCCSQWQLDLALCFGSSSGWKPDNAHVSCDVQLTGYGSSRADDTKLQIYFSNLSINYTQICTQRCKFSSCIFWWHAAFIFFILTKFSVPLELRHPHNICNSPPRFLLFLFLEPSKSFCVQKLLNWICAFIFSEKCPSRDFWQGM